MKILQISLLTLIAVALAAQAVRPQRPALPRTQSADLFTVQPAPEAVRSTIQEACYDCHSNRPRYPWYAQVQPIAWWLDRHVEQGREHLNFSEFGRYASDRAAHKLDQSSDEIEDDTMPLRSYRWLHPRARLTPEQKKRILDWLEACEAKIDPDADKAN